MAYGNQPPGGMPPHQPPGGMPPHQQPPGGPPPRQSRGGVSPLVVVACVGGALLLLIVVAVGAVVLLNRGSSGADDSASGAEPPEWDATLEPPEGMGEDEDPLGDDGLDDDFFDDEDDDEDAGSDGPEGSTVQPGNLEFTFESLDTDVDAIEATRGEFTANDRYVIVGFEVENVGDEMVMYFNAGVTLVDTDGVEYSASTEESTELRDLSGFSHNIEPGDSGPVEVAFDIPEDAEPYYLEVTDDGTGPSANMSLE